MAIAASSLFGFTGVALLLVLFFEKAQGLSALATGWRLLAMMGAYVVVSSLAARLVRRVGFKITLTIGLLLTAAVAGLLLGSRQGRGMVHDQLAAHELANRYA